MKSKKQIRKGVLTAKLTFFDWGWADNVIYTQKAKVNEKLKGIQMISKIKHFFGITNKDISENEEIIIRHEIEKIEWTRNEKGEIVSPFRTKREDG